MKIAVTTDKQSVDQRFGRCPYFLITTIDGENVTQQDFVDNEGPKQGHGAGIRAAQQVASLGVQAVLTGNLGPNATQALDRLGIDVYQSSGDVDTAIQDFIKGSRLRLTQTAEAHNGMKETILFPLIEDRGEDSAISEHFGHAPFFGIWDGKELRIEANDLDHTDAVRSPIDQIQERHDVGIIFAKSIGGRAIQIIRDKGLGLKTGPYTTVAEALRNQDDWADQGEACSR